MVTLTTPDGTVALTIPALFPPVVNVPATTELVIPVSGPTGGLGPEGPPGPPGPVGNLDEDLPDLTLLLENGLI